MKNTLLAQALGDAFGYIVEFDKWEKIKSMHGEDGLLYNPDILELVATDDTQMALFCLDGLKKAEKSIKEAGGNLEDPTDEIYKSFLDWYTTQNVFEAGQSSGKGLMSYRELFARRAPGHTCLSALGSKRKGSMKNPINDSKG